VSRIHDALRRRPRPALLTRAKPAAQADAVLAALGYRSHGSARPGALLTVLAVAAIVALSAGLAWMYWPAGASTPTPKAVVQSAPPKPAPPSQTPAPIQAPAPPPVVAHAEKVTEPPAMKPAAPKIPDPVVRSSPPAVTQHPALAPATSQPRPARGSQESGNADARPATVEQEPDELQRALYYQRTGEFELALVQYKKVLQRDELNIEAHNNLGILYQGKGLYEDAAREFQRVLAIDARYLTAHLNLSAAYLKLGRADAAAAEARAALAIDPRQSDAMVNLALAQDAAGQAADSALTLRRALELNPRHAVAHYNLAQQYERAGEIGLAIDHYRQFLQYAGSDQTPYLADVRARVAALSRGNK
jgi:Tfp pilus assembly protein PilF